MVRQKGKFLRLAKKIPGIEPRIVVDQILEFIKCCQHYGLACINESQYVGMLKARLMDSIPK